MYLPKGNPMLLTQKAVRYSSRLHSPFGFKKKELLSTLLDLAVGRDIKKVNAKPSLSCLPGLKELVKLAPQKHF